MPLGSTVARDSKPDTRAFDLIADDHLKKLWQVIAPEFPFVAAFGFEVIVLHSSGLQLLDKLFIALQQEVFVADRNP